MIFDAITIHDLAKPPAARLDMRRHCGPYTWTPSAPGEGRGFYTKGHDMLAMGDAPIDLRLASADDFTPRGSRQHGTYYFAGEDHEFARFYPVVARLPHSRGFLAGWVMGAGMCGSIDSAIHRTGEAAARAAHEEARIAAEREAEYQAEEDARIEAEEAAAQAREDEVAGLGTEE